MCRSLQKGPKVKVYINESGHNMLVLTVSKALLSYFVPNLAQLMQSTNHGLQSVVLHKTNAKAASWVLNWICTGGQDGPPTPAGRTQGTGYTDTLFKRLEVVLYLGIEGKLRTDLVYALRSHWEEHPTSLNEFIHKAYTMPLSTAAIRSTLVKATIDSVFACDMTVMSWCADKYGDAHDAFRLDLMAQLASSPMTNRILRKLQKGPLSTNQIHFIYLFTVHKSYLRRSIAKGLHVHINRMSLTDELVYRRYAKTNSEFMTDMHIAYHQMKKPAESKVAPGLQAEAPKVAKAKDLRIISTPNLKEPKFARISKAQESRLTPTPQPAGPKVNIIPKVQELKITQLAQVPNVHEPKSLPIIKSAKSKLDPIPKAQVPALTLTTKAQTPTKAAPSPQTQVQVKQPQQKATKAQKPPQFALNPQTPVQVKKMQPQATKATKSMAIKEPNPKAAMPKPRADEFYLIPNKKLSQTIRKMAYRNTTKETAVNKAEIL